MTVPDAQIRKEGTSEDVRPPMHGETLCQHFLHCNSSGRRRCRSSSFCSWAWNPAWAAPSRGVSGGGSTRWAIVRWRAHLRTSAPATGVPNKGERSGQVWHYRGPSGGWARGVTAVVTADLAPTAGRALCSSGSIGSRTPAPAGRCALLALLGSVVSCAPPAGEPDGDWPLLSGSLVREEVAGRGMAFAAILDPAECFSCQSNLARFVETRRAIGKARARLYWSRPPTAREQRAIQLHRLPSDGVVAQPYQRTGVVVLLLLQDRRLVTSAHLQSRLADSLLNEFQRWPGSSRPRESQSVR